MDTKQTREIMLLTNEYNRLIKQAQLFRLQYGVATKEEGLAYQRAAEVCQKLMKLNVGSEAEAWKKRMESQDMKSAEVYFALHPEEDPANKAVPSEKKNDSGKGTNNNENSSQGDEAISQETIKKWFRNCPKHGFDDVAGMNEVKDRLRKSVRKVSMPGVYGRLRIPKTHSFLFYGLPGCGKTFIIEAFVHEMMKNGDFGYMCLDGSDIHSKYVGEAEKIVRTAFEQACKYADEHEGCILFIDEVDGVCHNRSQENIAPHQMQLTTEFLTSVNKLKSSDSRVIFITATNYPANVDTAMLDRVELVKIPMPDAEARTATLRLKYNKFNDKGELVEERVKLGDDITWADMGARTEGYNQRDIDRLVVRMNDAILDMLESGCASEADAMALLDSGKICLSNEIFTAAVKSVIPTPKDELFRQLAEFEESVSRE